MKRILPAFLVGACLMLMLYSEAALDSASEALSLWWTRVLPALFPFYVLTSWMHRCGLLAWLQKRLRSSFPVCFLFGALAGYPTGARVCNMLECEENAAFCNLCSPMFLMGVVAVGMCNNSRLFWPLAIAHYGSALILGIIYIFCFQGKAQSSKKMPIGDIRPQGRMMEDLATGMHAMLNIGGCIIFFYVLANTLLTALIGDKMPTLSALLLGVAELTSGCRRASMLGLPINVTMGMMAFFVTFGGICVFAQASLVADIKRPSRYLVWKAAQGFLAAMIAYLLTPWLAPDPQPVISSTMESYGQNALIGATFLTSACVGLVGCYLLALVLHNINKKSVKDTVIGCPR